MVELACLYEPLCVTLFPFKAFCKTASFIQETDMLPLCSSKEESYIFRLLQDDELKRQFSHFSGWWLVQCSLINVESWQCWYFAHMPELITMMLSHALLHNRAQTVSLELLILFFHPWISLPFSCVHDLKACWHVIVTITIYYIPGFDMVH